VSRSGYSEDGDDDQWGMIRWRGAVASAMNGTRGQDFLKEMVDAMDAMPERRLIADELVAHGAVCAIGAVGLARKVPMEGVDPENYERVASIFGVAPALVQEVVYANDEHHYGITPEARWFRMRRWIIGQINGWHAPESDLMLGESG
jgi:hypothetical protein